MACFLQMAAIVMEEKNYKGLLITYCQKNAKPQPIFETPGQTGPPHNLVFTCKVFIDNQMLGKAEGKTKKSVENKAAKMALEALENREIVYQPDYIALLNHFCQKQKCTYIFVEVSRNGPSHDPEFMYSTKVREKEYPKSGFKKNKKQAKKEAAYLALKELRKDFPDDILELPEAYKDESESECSSLSGSASSISCDRGSEGGLSNSASAASEVLLGQVDYIPLLNRFCQKQRWICNFLDVQKTGASHISQFVCRVSIPDRVFPDSRQRSTKKEAKKEAAYLALQALREEFPGSIPELPKDFIEDSLIQHPSVSSAGNIDFQRPSSAGGLSNAASTNSEIPSHPSNLTPAIPHRIHSENGVLAATDSEILSATSSSAMSSVSNRSQSFPNPLSEFTDIILLDEGAFGKVVKAQKILDDKYYAVKIVRLRDGKYVQEVKALAHLEHKNIVRYYNAWKGQDCFADSSQSGSLSDFSGKETCLFIQMELCENGSLKKWIRKRNLSRHVDKTKSLDIFQQIIEGVKYIHDNKLIHRDLKPANILFTKEMTVKIGDFGLVTQMTGEKEIKALTRTQGTGTPCYMAPEQKEEIYEAEVDIYALGLILLELLWIFGSGHDRTLPGAAVGATAASGCLATTQRHQWKPLMEPRSAHTAHRRRPEADGGRPYTWSLFRKLTGKLGMAPLSVPHGSLNVSRLHIYANLEEWPFLLLDASTTQSWILLLIQKGNPASPCWKSGLPRNCKYKDLWPPKFPERLKECQRR
ncbi:interferon-induced, double-stranded RNA-activated protein kinase-like isoform X2 [Pseudophryne corroboree]|uniref:interferon-induced, double-stranded RNA-activated protein kinase-like isoform X2 n=1 Tax=Pseudophryne corroboree TaxID=495146 RepID=UPI0030813EEB